MRLRSLAAAFGSLTVLAALTGFLFFGSGSTVAIPDLYNTGVDEQKNALSAFVSDSHYQLRLPGGKTAPVQSAVYPGVANNRQGRWLTPLQGLPPQKAAGEYVWSTRFTMPAEANPRKTVLTGRWAADSAGGDILVNGVPSGQKAAGAFTWSDFTLNGPFQPGPNTLQFVVRNDTTGPDGLRVEFTEASTSVSPIAVAADSGHTGTVTVFPQAQWIVTGNTASIVVVYTGLTPTITDVLDIDWGDNTGDWFPGVATDNHGTGAVQDSHTYSQAGVYTVMADADGVSAPASQVTVVDNPAQLPPQPTVQFSQANYSATEDSDQAMITVNLSAASQQEVVVSYATSAGTAVAGTNYQDTSGVLIFSPGVTQQSFYVSVADDGRDAPDKTVNLTLSGPANATLGNPSSAVLTIQDVNDPPTVQLSSNTNTALENNTAITLSVMLSTASDYPVTATYNTADGTAIAGTNYTAAINQQLTFSPGTTIQNISIPILNDGMVAPNTYFTLTLSAPSHATLGPISTTTVYIVDSANKVTMSTPITYALESNRTPGQIVFTRQGDTTADLSVAYALGTNGAHLGTSGTPSYAPSGSVIIPAGSSTTTLTITPADDNIVEGTQTLTALLCGGLYLMSEPYTVSFTVVDTLFWYQNANAAVASYPRAPGNYIPGDTNSFGRLPYWKAACQKDINDCWYIAAAAGLCYQGRAQAIVNMIQDNGDGTYNLPFPNQTALQNVTPPSPASIATWAWSNGIWMPLLEAGYVQANGYNGPSGLNWASITGDAGTKWLTGHSTSGAILVSPSLGVDPNFTNALHTSLVVTATTGFLRGTNENGVAPSGIVQTHVYTVLNYDPNTQLVTLRNPWGFQRYNPNPANPLPPPDDGIFTMSFSDFCSFFTFAYWENAQ